MTRKKLNTDCPKHLTWINLLLITLLSSNLNAKCRQLGFQDDPLSYIQNELDEAQSEWSERANELQNELKEDEQGMEDWLSQTQHQAQEKLSSLNQAAEDEVNYVENSFEDDIDQIEEELGEAYESLKVGMSNSRQASQDESVLTLNQLTGTIELSGQPQEQMRFFSLKLKNRDDDDNLIIKLITDDPFSDPDLYISFSNNMPDSSSNADFQCASEGRDTCTVSSSFIKDHLQRDQTVFIGVKCSHQCRFRLRSQLQSTILLMDNHEMQIEIKTGESKLFRVHVPSQSELGGQADDRISSITILAAPLIQAAYDASNDFTLSATAKQGLTPGSDTSHSIQGKSVWANGKAIHFSETDNLEYSIDNQWCTDCYITILLSVLAEGRYTIISKANVGKSQRVFENTPLYGVSKAGEKTCYNYHIKDGNKNLDVRFKLYSGSSRQSIDALDIPVSWDNSDFQLSGAFDTEYVLTPRMRKSTSKGDQQAGLYYICNYAHLYSSYSLLIKEIPEDQQFTMLENGFRYEDQIQQAPGGVIPIKHYLYRVPKLDFGDEDIKLRFELEVINGPVPKMAIKYCNTYQQETSAQALKRCSNEIVSISAQDIIYRASSSGDEQSYHWATQTENSPVVVYEFDHDENTCITLEGGRQQESKCFYQVMVIGQFEYQEQTARYKLSATRFQKNKQMLRGQLPKLATVGYHEIRWFQYTLSDSIAIQKLSFQLKTFHGDADLFVSRTNEFPEGKDDNDLQSNKTRGLIDRVDFSKDDQSDLTGNYYIGVKGYQDSSFEIKCVVQRDSQSEWDVMQGNSLDRYYQLLYDGYPSTGVLHNELDIDRYRIDVNMDPGFEKAIVIDVTVDNFDNDVMLLISYKRDPSLNEGGSDFSIISPGNKQIRIEPGSEKFHSKGTYYIFVAPINDNFLDEVLRFFTDDFYSYTIKYTLEGSYEFLHYDLLTQSQQEIGTVRKFSYIVPDSHIAQTVNLNIYEGSMFVKASLQKDDIQDVNVESGSSDGILPIRTGQGFTKKFGQADFTDPKNIQCQDQRNACVIYIGVACVSTDTTCKYSLKMSDENSGPEKILVGQPIQSTIDEYQLNYYYISVTERHVMDDQPIFVVLNTIIGDADLYIKLQENSNLIKKSKWELPTTRQYDYRSEETMSRDLIQVTSNSLKRCVQKSKQSDLYQNLSNNGEQAECAILIGVHGKMGRGLSRYDLVSYVNIQILLSERSVYSIVEKGQYQYYIYEVNCDDCEVVIGLQDYTGGDPDLYINYGQKNLPDKDDYHFKSTSSASEVFILNLDNPYFQKKNIKSMKGFYSIGVHGNKKSSYTITATQNEHKLVMLEKGVATRNSQEQYETTFYRWYNPQIGEDRDDLKVSLKVYQGKVDVFLNSYDDFDETDIVDKLPDSARKSFYQLKNLKPTSIESESEVLIHSSDQNYCQQCWLLIGVHTLDIESDYEIKISQMKANFENSHFLKMGTPQSDLLPKDQAAIYKFIIDTKSAITINQQVTQGSVDLYIGNKGIPTSGNKIAQISDSGSVTFDPKDDNFNTAVIYQITAVSKGPEDARFTITLTQPQSIISIQDGVPWKVLFTDSKDVSKNFMMKLPKGRSTLTLQIQPVVAASNYKFQPFLYYKQVDNLGSQIDSIDFPPSGSSEFKLKRTYEGNGFLQITKVVDIDSDDAAILFTVYMQPNRRQKQDQGPHEVMVFASTQQEQLLVENHQLLENLFDNEQVVYLRLDESFSKKPTGFTYIEVATCLGSQKVKFLKNTEDPSSLIAPNQSYKDKVKGREVTRFKNPINQDSFYVEVQAVDLTDPKFAFRDGNGQRSQFMIQAFQSDLPIDNDDDQFKPISSKIFSEMSATSENVLHLEWYPLLNHNPGSSLQIPKDSLQYWIFMTTDMEANLDSDCLLNADVQASINYVKFRTSEVSKDVGVKPGKRYKVNVVAEIYSGEYSGTHYIYESFSYQPPGKEQVDFSETKLGLGSQNLPMDKAVKNWVKNKSQEPYFWLKFTLLCCICACCCNLVANAHIFQDGCVVLMGALDKKVRGWRGLPQEDNRPQTISNGIRQAGQELSDFSYRPQNDTQNTDRSSDFESVRIDAVVATDTSDEDIVKSSQ